MKATVDLKRKGKIVVTLTVKDDEEESRAAKIADLFRRNQGGQTIEFETQRTEEEARKSTEELLDFIDKERDKWLKKR